MSISFVNRSASSAKLAFIPFRVLVKLPESEHNVTHSDTNNRVTRSVTTNCVINSDINNCVTTFVPKNNVADTATDNKVTQSAKYNPPLSSRPFSTTSRFPLSRSTHSKLKNISSLQIPKTTPPCSPESNSLFTPTIRTVTKTEPYKHHLAADKNGRMRKYHDLSDIRPSVTTEQVVEFDRLNFHKVTHSDGSVNKYYDLSDIHPKPKLTRWTLTSAA